MLLEHTKMFNIEHMKNKKQKQRNVNQGAMTQRCHIGNTIFYFSPITEIIHVHCKIHSTTKKKKKKNTLLLIASQDSHNF